MIIKTFIGDSWEAAEEKMLQAMGPEAIVLNKRRYTPKITEDAFSLDTYEITAGVEEKNAAPPLINYTLEEIENILNNLQTTEELPNPSKEEVDHQVSSQDGSRAFSGLCESLWKELGKTETPPFEKFVDHLAKSTESLRAIQTPSHPWSLKEFLSEKGIGKVLLQQIENSIKRQFGTLNFSEASSKRDQALHLLCRELSRAIRVFGPITFDVPAPKVIALVGPSGSGKSTVAFKLAYSYAQELKKRVMIIALENPSSLQPYQRAPTAIEGKIPVRWVKGKNELQDLYAQIQENVDLVVIDTFSCNPYSWKEIDKLTPLLTEAVPAETHLVISALTKDVDAIGMVQRYAPLAPASFILTKIDETAQQGVLVNICTDTHLPVSYLSAGSEMKEALEIADAGMAARKILLAF
jgi:flagellar biosynthesis protein FlhF